MLNIGKKTPAEVAELHPSHPDIIRIAEYGYALLGQVLGKDPETIYRRRWCKGVKLTFYDGLVKKGYDPRSVIRTRGWLQPHHYLDLGSDRGLILVDGNWQQFVPRRKRTDSLPKVAVGTAEEVVDLAANAGVREGNLDYWREGHPVHIQHEERKQIDTLDFGDELDYLLAA